MKSGTFWTSNVCLIVDANVAGQFLARSHPVTNWLLGDRGNPRLVAAGPLREELARLEAVRRLLVQLERAGRLRSIDASKLRPCETRLRKGGLCRSNDRHILALAIVSGARTLATLDRALAGDFKDYKIINKPRGRIYNKPEVHGHLLCRAPGSCGIRAGGK